MDDFLISTRDGPIAELRLNRPAARNALSGALIRSFHNEMLRLAKDAETHIIIVSAEGPVFCAGHDLKEITQARTHPDKGQAFFEETMHACAAMMQSIVTCPKPVIAKVQGTATAAGCQLVASCDLAIAANTAKFATPGVNIGLFCSTPMVALSRNVPRKLAMEMLLTGTLISAEKAEAIGLINAAVPPDMLDQSVNELAQAIAAKSPKVLNIGKEAFYAQAEMPLSEAYDYAAKVMVANLLDGEAKEGIGAFIEKRPPNWQPLASQDPVD